MAFCVALLVVTLGLNIANVGINARDWLVQVHESYASSIVPSNGKDSEFILTYGGTPIGLAAAFISLASNLCATMLVGVKAWYVTLTPSHASVLLTE